MTLPNVHLAIVDPEKVRGYLLSESHPIGRFKGAFFSSLGYSAGHWERLRDDILALARANPAASHAASPFGQKFEVDGILTGPNGNSAQVRTVWIVLAGEQSPRLVTAFPR